MRQIKIIDPIIRFYNQVNKTAACWEWTGTVNTSGYGIFSVRRKRFVAHKWLYELLNGEIANKLDLDHLCRNRKCVRPDHLEPVTRGENCRRGIRPKTTTERAKLKMQCKNGHAYTKINTAYDKAGKYVLRRCRKCHSIREANRRSKLKQLTKELI